MAYTFFMLTGAHRALPDVVAMERVMTHPTLINCLAKIPTRTYDRMMELWTTQKLVFSRSTALVMSLGKPSITKV